MAHAKQIIVSTASVRVWEVLVYARIKPSAPRRAVGSKATPPYGLLGGMPTQETSVDVLLPTSVTESPKKDSACTFSFAMVRR